MLRSIPIQALSCNESVALFLSYDGTVYSYGNDPSRLGLLGQGEIYTVSTPQPVTKLLDHAIRQVSVGPTHACALNSLGRLFTWGTGLRGQLGREETRSTVPRPVESTKVLDVRQAVCSPSATAVVTGMLVR